MGRIMGRGAIQGRYSSVSEYVRELIRADWEAIRQEVLAK
jgi:Arc/MetJ-type ribon-helix-helix transcriptional regulator